jgi:hypothetical protein
MIGADSDGQAHFATLWQSRVEKMLLEHADDPGLVEVSECLAAA